jgi:hypothetical protein
MIPYDFKGAGFSGFKCKNGVLPEEMHEIHAGLSEFENKFYRLSINTDGSINSLEIPGERKIMKPGDKDSVLTLGDEIFVPEGASKYVNGPVAVIIESYGKIGPVPVIRKTICYHELPWFDQR